MSGFLPDLASWALRGGAGGNDDENNEEEGADQSSAAAAATTDEQQLTAEELRAQRLARMELLQQRAREEQQKAEQEQQEQQPEPMDVDVELSSPSTTSAPSPSSAAETQTATAPEPAKSNKPSPRNDAATTKEQKSKKRSKSESSPADASRKLQRKKELLLKKILSIALAGTSTTSDSHCVVVDIGATEISVQTIAEILATRLSLDSASLQTQPPQKPVMAYLAQCHRRAAEESKSISTGKNAAAQAPLIEILQEIQRQVVSYAASCLIEPDLFESAADATQQLARCLQQGTTDLQMAITNGVQGSSSSFYYLLCEELIQQQDVAVLDKTVQEICRHFCQQLSKCESVLDDSPEGRSSMVLVTALTALCLHKRAAQAVTNMPTFLLPAAGTAEASQVVRPTPPAAGSGNIFQFLATIENRPHLKRSGPALEKGTVLGAALGVGAPKNNAAFSSATILRQSVDSVERTTGQQRQQLRVHQEACNQFVVALVKAGQEPRKAVMQWFVDALLVNVHASGFRPDPSKISSDGLRLNVSVILLKLCEPFVNDERKQHLIDPGFVSSPADHGGVFCTLGDDAVARLGESSSRPDDGDHQAMMTDITYSPKNSFIPQCFFLCARSLHFGIAPLLGTYEQIMRGIGHIQWEIMASNRDPQSDPNFSMMVSRQRAFEVALFQEDTVADTLLFCNLMAKFLFEMDDATLATMPEDFVSDICDIIMHIAKWKAKLLRGIEFRYVFKLVVKLLSAKYASMVRNYNLRAMLGDVLYELYLPQTGLDRRDIPSSIATDSLAGGQTYLLSDPMAQETLAPSLLLLYGEVEHTGYYDKMGHRAKIASLIKYLWESTEHRPAFRRITQNKQSFIKFANGIMNETNTLIATVMQKLPEIREAQEKMKNTEEWGRLSEDEQGQISSRLEDAEREVRSALPLCNKTLQMFGYLNTDQDIRSLFLLEELCPRLVQMLVHVLTKLVGSKGLDLKVDNPEQYEFRPKEMLRDLCAIFALFAGSEDFQVACAKLGCDPNLLRSAVKTCRRLNLLTGESMVAFESLPDAVEAVKQRVTADDALEADAPDEFLDEILSTFMKDPVILPSGHYVDRSTITQHLLNDPIDPFNREPMTVDDIKPATELKERMNKWLEEKRAARDGAASQLE